MANTGRLNNSIKNLASGLASRFLIVILGLVVRTVFIRALGNEYLGVNGLYTNILSMLSLAELGFGTAIVYSMYKPLAQKDYSKLASLMTLYKKFYRVIGLIILAIGLAIVPFLDNIIKDPPDIPYLTFYYLLFLLNSVLSYLFFAFRRSILVADQKEHVCSNYHMVFNITKTVVQMIVLLVLKNFTAYLIVQLGTTVLENLTIARYSKKHYPEVVSGKGEPLSKSELTGIAHNVKALTLSRLGHVILNNTSNIIISGIAGISWVGLLSNFTLIVDSITGVLCQVTSALSASMGNFFTVKSKDESYELFSRIEFLNSWLYGFSTTCLFILLNPFVTIWIGTEYTLSTLIVFAICLNFFVQGYMNTLWTFRSTLGLFTQGWIRPLILAILNIIFAVTLGMRYGVFGILIANSLARACVSIWYDPLIIHKYGFERSVKPFFIMYFFRVLEIGSIVAVLSVIKYYLTRSGVTILNFILLMVITVVVMLGMFWIYSHRRDEYKYFYGIAKEKLSVIIKR